MDAPPKLTAAQRWWLEILAEHIVEDPRAVAKALCALRPELADQAQPIRELRDLGLAERVRGAWVSTEAGRELLAGLQVMDVSSGMPMWLVDRRRSRRERTGWSKALWDIADRHDRGLL